jgi:hypothetical protein
MPRLAPVIRTVGCAVSAGRLVANSKPDSKAARVIKKMRIRRILVRDESGQSFGDGPGSVKPSDRVPRTVDGARASCYSLHTGGIVKWRTAY